MKTAHQVFRMIVVSFLVSLAFSTKSAFAEDLPCVIKVDSNGSVLGAINQVEQMGAETCTIWVAPGTYHEGLLLTSDQSHIKNLTIIGSGMDRTILRRFGGDSGMYINVTGEINVTIKNLTFDGTETATNFSIGIWAGHMSGTLKLDSVRITNYRNEGVAMGGGYSGSILEMYRCVVDHNNSGVMTSPDRYDYEPQVLLVNNTFVNNTYAGVYVFNPIQASHINIVNNVIVGSQNGIEARYLSSESRVFAEYNDLFGNNVDVVGQILGDPITNIHADPRFINPNAGNYHLRANSPAINAGDPLSPRDSNGTRSDIGAFSYNGLARTPAPEPQPLP